MSLFNVGWFRLHSSKWSDFKIDCDALSPQDLHAAAAWMSRNVLLPFGKVKGIPRGGVALAHEFESFIDKDAERILIVDDVSTTGASMEMAKIGLAIHNREIVIGAVLFWRGEQAPPAWISPLFRMYR